MDGTQGKTSIQLFQTSNEQLLQQRPNKVLRFLAVLFLLNTQQLFKLWAEHQEDKMAMQLCSLVDAAFLLLIDSFLIKCVAFRLRLLYSSRIMIQKQHQLLQSKLWLLSANMSVSFMLVVTIRTDKRSILKLTGTVIKLITCLQATSLAQQE